MPVSDAGGSLTVDGTVSVNQHTVLGSGTFAVQVSTALPAGTNAIGKLAANSGVDIGDVDITSIAAGDNNIGNVDIVSVPAPLSTTGGGTEATALRVTVASDSTGVLSVDDNGGSLTVDGTVSVNQHTVLGNGTFSVQATSVIPGTGATNLGKAVGNAGGATDTGVPPLAIRDDTLSSLSDAEGDYVPLRVNSTGALHVTGAGGGTQYNTNDTATTVATGTLSLVERDDSLSSLSQADGEWAHLRVNANGALWVAPIAGSAEFTDDSTFVAGSSTIVMTGAVFDDSSPDSVNEGDAGAVRMSARREMYVQIRDAAGNERGLNIDASGRIAVTGAAAGTEYNTNSVATTLAAGTLSLVERDDVLSTLSQADGDWAHMRVDSQGALWVRDLGSATTQPVAVMSIAAGDNNIGNVDIVTVPAPLSTTGGGTEATALRVTVASDSTGVLSVDDNGGSLTVDGTVSVNQHTILGSGTFSVQVSNNVSVIGPEADGATATTSPVMHAGVSQDVTLSPGDAAPTNRNSSAGMVTRVATDRDGAVFVRTHPPQSWSYHLDTSSAQTDATVANAAGAGLSHYIGTVVFSSGAATAINLLVSQGNTTTILGPYYLEATAGRGMAVSFNPPRKAAANMSICITTSASIAHSVDITGFTAP